MFGHWGSYQQHVLMVRHSLYQDGLTSLRKNELHHSTERRLSVEIYANTTLAHHVDRLTISTGVQITEYSLTAAASIKPVLPPI